MKATLVRRTFVDIAAALRQLINANFSSVDVAFCRGNSLIAPMQKITVNDADQLKSSRLYCNIAKKYDEPRLTPL